MTPPTELLREIAAGLGDEYEATGALVGLLPRSKRGDSVMHIAGTSAELVVEMTDSPPRAFGPYLDEAGRNRGAAASLGSAWAPKQNGGLHVREGDHPVPPPPTCIRHRRRRPSRTHGRRPS